MLAVARVLSQLAEQDGAVFLLVGEGQAHGFAEVLFGGGLVGDGIHLQADGAAGMRDFVDVHGGESQEAHQQEIANNDEDRAVHGSVAREDRTGSDSALTWSSSASRSSSRRAGRSWKILKIDTKMMPNEVEE